MEGTDDFMERPALRNSKTAVGGFEKRGGIRVDTAISKLPSQPGPPEIRSASNTDPDPKPWRGAGVKRHQTALWALGGTAVRIGRPGTTRKSAL